MGTFTWSAGTSADWNTAADWTLVGGTGTAPPGSASTETDIVTFGNSSSGTGNYAVTIAKGETFDVATINIGNSGSFKAPALTITGTLLTDTLNYTTPAGKATTPVTINASGILDIRTAITTTSSVGQVLSIAANVRTGIGSGAHLELGSATNNGANISNSNVTAKFNNLGATALNAGVIECLGGFTNGEDTNLTISNVANGDEFIFDGANFTGDKATLSGTTLTVTSGTDPHNEECEPADRLGGNVRCARGRHYCRLLRSRHHASRVKSRWSGCGQAGTSSPWSMAWRR